MLVQRFWRTEIPAELASDQSNFALFAGALLVFDIGAMSVLLFFIRSFATLIGIATTISFLTAPINEDGIYSSFLTYYRVPII